MQALLWFDLLIYLWSNLPIGPGKREPHPGCPAGLPVSFSEMTPFESGDVSALLKYLASAPSPSSLRLPWREDALVTACLVEKHEKDKKIELPLWLNGLPFSSKQKELLREDMTVMLLFLASPLTFSLVCVHTFSINPFSPTFPWSWLCCQTTASFYTFHFCFSKALP